MKRTIKHLFWLVAFTLSLFMMIQISSCSDTTDTNTTVSCSGCDSSTPWSKAGTGRCYATQADCEAKEGKGCVLCD